MEYLNVGLGITSYFLAAGTYAALRRDEAGEGTAFEYFIDFLFYSLLPLTVAAVVR